MKKFVLVIFLFSFGASCFSQGTWTQKADFGGVPRYHAFAFSIGARGYMGGGINSWNQFSDFWEWDPASNVWTQKANFGGPCQGIQGATGFSIGNKGYVGTGANGTLNRCLWEYDPVSNAWIKKSDFGGGIRHFAVGFSIANKGYIGSGTGSLAYYKYKDFWEYDPVQDVWTQKSNFPGGGRDAAVGFSIGNKGYIGTGYDSLLYRNDFWEWDQPTNTWSQKSSFIGSARTYAVAFSIGNYGYIGTGASSTPGSLSDMWQYNPVSDSWLQVANYGGGGSESSDAFVIGCKGYVGLGYTYVSTFSVTAKNDFWEFEPPLPSAAISGDIVICEGDTTSLLASGGLFFQWSNGSSNNSIQVNPTMTTSYSVIVSDVCGADTAFITVVVNPTPKIKIGFNPDLCGSGLVSFSDSSAFAATWHWSFGDGNTSVLQNPTNIYSTPGQYTATLTISSSNACSSSEQFVVDVPPFSELYVPNAFSPNDDGNNDVYFISGSCIDEMHLSIYNRWGEKIFETTDKSLGWDGRYKGEKQNAGVYMYAFKGTLSTGAQISKNGNITLMK